MGATFVYVSCAEDGEIASYALDSSGMLSAIARVKVAKGVMPMAVSPDRRFLYVVSRPVPYAIHVLAIHPDTGALTPSSTSPLPASLPYISFDRSGRFLLGASYHQNLVTVTAVGADGRVAPAPLQTIPVGRNAHSIRVDLSNRFVFVPTLGSDALFMFRFDTATRALVSNTPPLCLTPSGAGPRHFEISSDNRFLYVLCEMTGAILTFALDAESGLLTEAGSVAGLAPDCALVPGVPRGCAAKRAGGEECRPRHLGGRRAPRAERQIPLCLGAHRKHAQCVRRRPFDGKARLPLDSRHGAAAARFCRRSAGSIPRRKR
jgi:6-phosphogluconolactonase